MNETKAPAPAFWRAGATLRIQSVLHHDRPDAIARSAASLARAAGLALAEGACARVALSYGDRSSLPGMAGEVLEALRRDHGADMSIGYHHFGAATAGWSEVHNRLAEGAEADFLLLLDPTIVVSPRTLQILLSCFQVPGVGLAEARRLPTEPPKDYDARTGETSWASAACAMVPMALFRELGGFDAEGFPGAGADVDFSWRVRKAGLRVLHQPAAAVFQDRRLAAGGLEQPQPGERGAAAGAALVLAHKWSGPTQVAAYLQAFRASGDPEREEAARDFELRQAEGRLPPPIPDGAGIGHFDGLNHASQRYAA